MKARTWIMATAVAALGLVAAQRNAAREAPSLQLVYHSDTRGYYRPCG